MKERALAVVRRRVDVQNKALLMCQPFDIPTIAIQPTMKPMKAMKGFFFTRAATLRIKVASEGRSVLGQRGKG